MLSQPETYAGNEFKNYEAPAESWIKAIERLRGGPTIAFCNAETAIYRGSARIIDAASRFKTLVYTNASRWSLRELMKIQPRKNLRLYISYHPEFISVDDFVENVKRLRSRYIVQNCHSPAYPPLRAQLVSDRGKMKKAGIDLKIDHEYLGEIDGKFYPSYLGRDQKFLRRFKQKKTRRVLCKTSFDHFSTLSRAYTVAPDGDFYLCWRYLYARDERGVIGNFFDPEFEFKDQYYECYHFGDCHICAWHKKIIDPETGETLDDDRLA